MKRLQAATRPIVLGTAVVTAVTWIGSLFVLPVIIANNRENTLLEEASQDDVFQARQAIGEAYGEKNEELRMLKLREAVSDFYENRVFSQSTYSSRAATNSFSILLTNGVSANDLVSIIDTVCPYQEGQIESCNNMTVGNNQRGDMWLPYVLSDYAEGVHLRGISTDKALEALNEARKIVIKSYEISNNGYPPSLTDMPGLMIYKASEILELPDKLKRK